VLRAEEFRFNEAMLLGRSMGMDVARLKQTGLIEATGDKVKMLPASARRREKAVKTEQEQMTLFGPSTSSGRRGRAGTSRKVNPQDEYFSSAIDMCHALALRYADAHGGANGLAAAKGIALQLGWGADSACCRLMTALVNAAPPGVQFPGPSTSSGRSKQKTAADEFPEFRAWREMLKPVFGIDPPEWKEPVIPQQALALEDDEDEDEESEE